MLVRLVFAVLAIIAMVGSIGEGTPISPSVSACALVLCPTGTRCIVVKGVPNCVATPIFVKPIGECVCTHVYAPTCCRRGTVIGTASNSCVCRCGGGVPVSEGCDIPGITAF